MGSVRCGGVDKAGRRAKKEQMDRCSPVAQQARLAMCSLLISGEGMPRTKHELWMKGRWAANVVREVLSHIQYYRRPEGPGECEEELDLLCPPLEGQTRKDMWMDYESAGRSWDDYVGKATPPQAQRWAVHTPRKGTG